MCYSISQMKQKAYKAALRDSAPQEEIDRLYNEWQESQRTDTEDDQTTPMAYLNGYDHPRLYTLIYTDNWQATRFEWGLIPEWTKSESDALTIRNKTLNARGESMFDKPAFKQAAIEKRCLIFVDGFFEYHHKNGRTFPHFIQHKEKDSPLVFGGLWSFWKNPTTGQEKYSTSIITTIGNDLMMSIHNNPKLEEARMPLILLPSQFETWLQSKHEKEIKQLVQPYPSDVLEAYPVRRLIGVKGIGDVPQAVERIEYPDLTEQGRLF